MIHVIKRGKGGRGEFVEVLEISHILHFSFSNLLRLLASTRKSRSGLCLSYHRAVLSYCDNRVRVQGRRVALNSGTVARQRGEKSSSPVAAFDSLCCFLERCVPRASTRVSLLTKVYVSPDGPPRAVVCVFTFNHKRGIVSFTKSQFPHPIRSSKHTIVLAR
jgi:hypothetical protein